jgi:hypothetical protein
LAVDTLINTLGMKNVRILDWLCVEPVIAYDPYENANRENLAFGIEGKMNFSKQNKKK